MERTLRTPVKELIGRFPEVGRILDGAGIGCVPCSVGTCLLSDIVEIHNLSAGEERELLGRIAAVLFPDRAVPLPEIRRSGPAVPPRAGFSPPMKRLVDEHRRILRFVALVPAIAQTFDPASEEHRRLLHRGIGFIRGYADRFHHAKEEEILFGYFDPGLDILVAMRDDHRRGRERVKETLDALERGDAAGVAAGLSGYAEILAEHIRKEDGILYPWMDRNLSTRQVGEMYARFLEVDAKFEDERRDHEAFLDEIEAKFATEVIR